MKDTFWPYIISGFFGVISFLSMLSVRLASKKIADLEKADEKLAEKVAGDHKMLAESIRANNDALGENLKELTNAIQGLQLSLAKQEAVNSTIDDLKSKVEKLTIKVTKLEVINGTDHRN